MAASYRTTLIPIAALLACGGAYLLVMLNTDGRTPARGVRNSMQIRSIATALSAALNEHKGRRLPDSIQSHADLYSWMTTQNLIAADLLISPLENHPTVTVHTAGTPFQLDLNTRCNASYAMPPLDASDRFSLSCSNAPLGPIMALRGPRHCADADAPYSAHFSKRSAGWAHTVCFSDSHCESLSSPMINGDCIFQGSASPGSAPDIFLVIQKSAAAAGAQVTDAELSWD